MEYLQISSEQLRRSMPEVFARVVGGGHSYEVTRHGRPVFRIVPIEGAEQDPAKNEQRATG